MRRRRRLMSAALPAAVVLAVVVGVVFSEPGDSDRDMPDVDAVAAANAELSVQPGALDWEARPATLGWQVQNVTADGVLYALSTAPGARWEDFPNGDIPKAIYTSTDGTNWTGHAVGGSWMSSIAAADGLLYAVGTGPGAEADSAALRIGVSDDRGETFESTEIALGANQPGSLTTNVMATSRGVLATASSRTSNDPISLLPPGALAGGTEPVVLEEGIAVFPPAASWEAQDACFGQDRERCEELVEHEATDFFSWEDLGLGEDEVMFGEVVAHSAYWSGDGDSFEEVEYPFPDGFVDQVFDLSDQVAVSLAGPDGTDLFASEDARSWRRLDDLPPIGWVTALGQVESNVVIVGQSPDGRGVSVFRADDLSGPWEEIPMEDLLGLPSDEGAFVWASAATVGENGVAIHLTVEQTSEGGGNNPITAVVDRIFGSDATGPEPEGRREVDMTGLMLISHDLASWSVVPTSELGGHVDSLVTAPDGRLIAHAVGVDEAGMPIRRQFSAQP